METREGLNGSEVRVVGSDVPSDYRVSPSQVAEGSAHAPQHMGVSSHPPPAAVSAGVDATTMKKKRGRPRKYSPDGAALFTLPLSPKPISSSAPLSVIDFSATVKRGKVQPVGPVSKPRQPKLDFDPSGEWISTSLGANFTPHIITVNTGEDVTMKIISFSQQRPRGICVLSANGVISSVTLRQPDSSGGTLTYEGRFEILSLTGSFMPSEMGGIRNRSGGMSVSLASPDGRVVGGAVAGMLVAAAPIQIVVGSFVAENQLEQQNIKKQRQERVAVGGSAPIRSPETENYYRTSGKPALLSPSSIHLHPDSRNKPT
ncbi:unnamed protein product, partial [Cuscuta europaea]